MAFLSCGIAVGSGWVNTSGAARAARLLIRSSHVRLSFQDNPSLHPTATPAAHANV
jgi:hypothetical protein